ncbi:MAG: S-layer protein [Candidatus Aenigmarchaeota archaeon]|nr:S-layer protein [Candidatus Aenigmarchaeota archaeon]
MYLINRKNGKLEMLSAKEARFGCAPLAMKILRLLAKKPSHPRELARQLGQHEQKIYYHIRKLEARELIRVVKRENFGGVTAKIYALTSPAFFVRFRDFEHVNRLPSVPNPFLSPFVQHNKLDAIFVVGSPDPHGPEMARSRDGYYAIDLALFLGSFISNAMPCVKLDTGMRQEDLKDNLIIIGGPIVNKVTKKLNDKMAVRFNSKNNIYSSLTKKTYYKDEAGLIVKMPNPFAKDRHILVIAGKRSQGTKAAILALLQKFDEISKKQASVVQGSDEDGDGIVDSVRIME